MFKSKNKNKMYTYIYYYIKVGCKGVFITRTCYHDENSTARRLVYRDDQTLPFSKRLTTTGGHVIFEQNSKMIYSTIKFYFTVSSVLYMIRDTFKLAYNVSAMILKFC